MRGSSLCAALFCGALASTTGCSFERPQLADDDVDAGPPRDAGCDGVVLPFAAANVGTCVDTPIGELVFPSGDTIIDTDDGTIASAGGAVTATTRIGVLDDGTTPALFVVGTNVSIRGDAKLRIRGGRALVLVATGQMEVFGTILANSTADVPGAYGNMVCDAHRGGDGNSSSTPSGARAGTGGGGGGYASQGGRGASISPPPQPSQSALGGDPRTGTTPALVAGCPGGRGGVAMASDVGARGGGGGGAVELVAGVSLSASGIVSVSGGGGGGAASRYSGGAGGGSGGTLVLQSPTITFDGAILTANGRGGGAGNDGGAPSSPGRDGFVDDDTPAEGGYASVAGNGGQGGAATTPPLTGTSGSGTTSAPTGGGGGGGSAGAIWLVSHEAPVLDYALISPPPRTDTF